MYHFVVFDSLRLVAQIIGPHIDGDDFEVRCKRLHLMTPRIPEIRKAMYKDDWLSLTEGHVVKLYPVIVSIMMLDVVPYIFQFLLSLSGESAKVILCVSAQNAILSG
jgi:hypothetical protein